ncbi:trypsin-like serine protease [Catellatospora sichuanensis]|uniref:trypsin-like serine protease n=1 Tax=Catellatospora sichuanensis TaxID=1969805 RepID=UPI001183D9DA|nr:trypsin-like serine protease [Catellatospora sichuanensis]
MSLRRRLLAYGLTASTIAATFAAGTALPAHAEPIAAPSLVDDGVYPGAAQILAEQNVMLVSGDGHILLADCATPPENNIGLLKVYTTDEGIGADGIGRVCFKVTAGAGWLSLRVPGVYEIRGDGMSTGFGHEVTAELVDDEGEEITVEVDPDGSTQVGLGADPTASPTMLLELRAGTGLAPVTGANAAVGKANMVDRMCTVSLVAPRWALGAAACFAADPLTPQLTEGAPAEPVHVVFPGHAAVAANWLTPVAGRDAVLVRLAAPIADITPLATATAAAPTGTALPAVGYGRTATEWINDQQQTAQIAFTASAATTLSATSGPLVCKGMAGAPVIVDNKIAAVLSQAGQEGCFDGNGTGSSVVAARLDGLTNWINAVVSSTADHTWPLADMPVGAAAGTPVTTTGDHAFTGTPLPMTATAGATWKTGDTFSPAIELNGTTGSLATATNPVQTHLDWGVSVWVKLDAYGGVVVSQDGNNSKVPKFKLWAEASDRSWRFSILKSFMTSQQIPSWDNVSTAPETAQLGAWTKITVQYQTSGGRNAILLKINDVAAASRAHNWNQIGGQVFFNQVASGPFRIGSARTGPSTFGNYLDGTVANVQTWSSASLPAGPATSCGSNAAVYGITADGKLTYTLIERLTGTLIRRLTSTATLGFTPSTMATINKNTLLVPSTTGNLYRVDITANTTELTFTKVNLGGTGWNFAQLTYDSSHLYGVYSTGAMRIYDFYTAKPVLTDITHTYTIASGFSLNTLAASGFMTLVGTQISDGALLSLDSSGSGYFYTDTLATWPGLSHLVSPGGGIYYSRNASSGVVTMHFDANIEDGSGADLTTYGTVNDPAGWTQTKLSAVLGCF